MRPGPLLGAGILLFSSGVIAWLGHATGLALNVPRLGPLLIALGTILAGYGHYAGKA